jgi:hypothetical protein
MVKNDDPSGHTFETIRFRKTRKNDMPIARKIAGFIENASWIRKMFEEGERLRAIHGAENVFDFTIGNPTVEPPAEFEEEFRKLANHPIPGMHRYMHNAGYEETRQAVAEVLAEKSGLEVTGSHIIMTCGAGGALNVALKTILNPGDEVIILTPFFVEYKFYIDNHGGVAWLFDKKGLIVYSKATDFDALFEAALEAGADDVSDEEGQIEVVTEPSSFIEVRETLEKAGFKYESAEVTMIPQTMVKLEGKQAESMLKLMDRLEDNDDVQNVYANFDISDEDMEKMM